MTQKRSKATTKERTTNDTTTKEPKTVIAVSVRVSLVARIKKLAQAQDRNFSSMCSVLLTQGITDWESDNGKLDA